MKTEERSFYGFREKGDTDFQSFALELVPSRICQLRCVNCYKRGKGVSDTYSNGRMPADFVRDAMLQAKKCGFSEIVFIGGEPTLHPELPLFIHQCLELGLIPILCTNGVRLADVQYADKVGLAGVTIVLHAPVISSVQDKVAGKIGYHEKLSKAFENLLDRERVTIVAEIVVIEEYLPYIPEMYQWCLNSGIIPFIEINRRYDTTERYGGTVRPEGVSFLFKKLAEIDPQPAQILVPPAYKQPCTMSITGLHVKNFGNGDYGGVYSCCAQGVRHGNLLERSLKEVLTDPGIQVFKDQDEWVFGPCRDCEFYPLCRGGCRGEAYLTFGCPRASSPVCWHIPAQWRENSTIMSPPTCAGCPLEGNPACKPQH